MALSAVNTAGSTAGSNPYANATQQQTSQARQAQQSQQQQAQQLQQAQQQQQQQQQPKPVANAQGQITGSRINTTA